MNEPNEPCIFKALIRDAGSPAQWQLDALTMRYVEIQVDKEDFLKCRAALIAEGLWEDHQ